MLWSVLTFWNDYLSFQTWSLYLCNYRDIWRSALFGLTTLWHNDKETKLVIEFVFCNPFARHPEVQQGSIVYLRVWQCIVIGIKIYCWLSLSVSSGCNFCGSRGELESRNSLLRLDLDTYSNCQIFVLNFWTFWLNLVELFLYCKGLHF